MHRAIRVLVASLFGLFFTNAFVSAATISGRVRDANANTFLIGASVSVRELDRATSTGPGGEYSFGNVPAGAYTLVVSYIGTTDVTKSVSVTVTDDARIDFALSSDVVKLGAFVVEGTREGQARALQQKRMSYDIMDAVSADAMGKFPDGNAAEALRRVPGVSMEIDQDEGRYVVVRGIDSALNNGTLNSQVLGTPSEAGNRGVAMDSVPADLIARLEVTKAVTPDKDGTAIGGSINIVTQSAFDRPEGFFFGSVSGNYDDFRNRTAPAGSLTFGRVLGKEAKWAVVAGVSYSVKIYKSQTSDNLGWAPVNGLWMPTTQESFDYDIMRSRLGANVALQFRPAPKHELALRLNHNIFTDHEARQKAGYEFKLGTLTNQTAVSGNNSGGRSTREFRAYNQTGTIDAVALEGKHSVWSDYNLTWQVGASRGERDVPKRDDWEYRSGTALANSYDLSGESNFVTPIAAYYNAASYPFRRVRYRHDLERENVLSAQVDLKRELELGPRRGYVKAGAKYVDRDKADDRENANYNLAGTAFTLAEPGLAGTEPENFFKGRYRFGPILNLAANEAFFKANPARFSKDVLGSLNNSVAGDFDAKERVLAAYGMASVDLSKEWTLLAGARLENTQTDAGANQLNTIGGTFSGAYKRITGSSDYANFMPGVHLSWRPNKKMVVRLAWTNTIGRPNYANLAPTRVVDNLETATGSGIYTGSISSGNPKLNAYEAMNFDVSVEYYLANAGIVSVGAFRKHIDNPVFGRSYTQTNVTIDSVRYSLVNISGPENAQQGKVSGLELNYQQFFNFLPSPFDGLGVNVNYTMTDSSVTIFGRTDPLPFFKQSDEVGNVAVVFEKYGFEARVAMSFNSPYLTGVGVGRDSDTYTARRRPIDAKASYRINRRLKVFVEGININEVPLKEFVGVSSRSSGNEIYRWKARFGVNFNL
jgi:TonB-dependent receptor